MPAQRLLTYWVSYSSHKPGEGSAHLNKPREVQGGWYLVLILFFGEAGGLFYGPVARTFAHMLEVKRLHRTLTVWHPPGEVIL